MKKLLIICLLFVISSLPALASYTRYKQVSFSNTYTGLSTVGYRLLSTSGTVISARTTTGVAEVLSGTGIYAATITFPDAFTGAVVWDTGGGSPVFASENINPGAYEYLDARVGATLTSQEFENAGLGDPGQIAAAVWNADTVGNSVNGTKGYELSDSHDLIQSFGTPGQIAAAIWNSNITSYTTAGTFGLFTQSIPSASGIVANLMANSRFQKMEAVETGSFTRNKTTGVITFTRQDGSTFTLTTSVDGSGAIVGRTAGN